MTPEPVRPRSLLVWLALATVYVVWGSTYLAIKVVVEADLPPLLSMGARFLVAATLLAVVIVIRRGPGALRVTMGQAAGAGVMGVALLLGGNGLVAIAEQTVPSGLAALLIATTPLWLAVFRYATGDRPRSASALGVLVGFAGVALLALRGGGIPGVETWGVLLLLAATLSWAIGSFMSPRLGLPKDPLVATTWEMVLGGAALLVAGAAAGERLHLSGVPVQGWAAWAYLVTVGSMLGYTAYVWLLANVPISLVATYAYVNPVVAVALGALILAEPVTGTVLLGGAVVVLGVAVVVTVERPRGAVNEDAAPAPEAVRAR